MLSGMDQPDSHEFFLMVIHNLDVRRAQIAIRPLETNSPPIVESYAELPLRSPDRVSNRFPGNAAKSRMDVAASSCAPNSCNAP